MSGSIEVPSSIPTPEERAPRSLREVLTFLAVGSIGFVIEAVILTALTSYAAWSPWQARIPSFLTAVLVTWALNRRHTFPNRGLQRRSTEAFFYTAIQGGGALINLGIFGVCLALAPALREAPIIPLAIGAVGGFVFNFALSSKWLYSRLRSGQSG
ncbi:MAG: GtrA family protein [Steroidobacter sp.]|nr:GtrA family protein [Steroidobacter sp.]